MRNKKKPEEPQEEGSPAWMNTYGDMVTLLLAFFVLLFSFSTIDAIKWEEIVNSLSDNRIIAITALDPNAAETNEKTVGRFVITSPTPSPEETPTAKPSEKPIAITLDTSSEEIQERFDELYEKIKNHIEVNNLGSILNVQHTDEYTLLLRMSDSAFFDSGKAAIKEDSKIALNEICSIIEKYTDLIQTIRIEGHADNRPIKTSKYKDNWDLSYDRTDTVRKYIMSVSVIDSKLLVPSYLGDLHPIATNETDEGRAQNRRVDFVIESILKANIGG